ncbi:MAG TPA: hypothetical protein VGB00_09210 [Pyrinomonadaceae bacterium]
MQKVFEILPLIGIANLKFGMSREESRISVLEPFSEHSNNKNADCYYNYSLQVFFDGTGKLEFIEISRDEDIEAVFRGRNVFKIPANDLIEEICQSFQLDVNDDELGYCFTFPDIELSFWRPVIPEDENDEDGKYFSTVGIGRKGYFIRK